MARAHKFWVRYFVAYTSGTAEFVYAKSEADLHNRLTERGKTVESFSVVGRGLISYRRV